MMFGISRHVRAAAGMVALLVLAACGEHSVNQPLPPARASASAGPSSNAALEAQINGLINALYAPKDQGSVHKEFAQIKAQIASGRTADAQTSIVTFFSHLLADSKNGVLQDPNGAQPPTTADALANLLKSVSTFGGIATPPPPASSDGAVAVIGAAGGTLLS